MIRRSFLHPSTSQKRTSLSLLFPTSVLFQPKRQISLMPLFDVALELTETALVSINSSPILHSALSTVAGAVVVGASSSSSLIAVSPLATMFLFGFLMRLTSLLALTLYSDRAQDRFASAMPTLCKHFLLYAEVAWNPHALKAEVELAATRLHKRRAQTLANFKTGNYRIWAPTFVSMLWVTSGCVAATALGPACLLPVATQSGGGAVAVFVGVNAIATGLWLVTFEQYIGFRKGFWDQRDKALDQLRNIVRMGALVWILFFTTVSILTFQFYAKKDDSAATAVEDGNKEKEEEKKENSSSSSFSHAQQSFVILLPFYFLGVSVAGLLRFNVFHKLAKSNTLAAPLRWPARRPKLHGTYGEYRWHFGEHLGTVRWAEKNTGEAKRAFDNYDKAKVQLEYDCDQRLSKMKWFKNVFADSRNARRPDMPAPPEDFHFVRGKGGNEQKIPENAELRTTTGYSRSGH
jgi:hypothetical protein